MKRLLIITVLLIIVGSIKSQILPSGVELAKGASFDMNGKEVISGFLNSGNGPYTAFNVSGSMITFSRVSSTLASQMVKTERLVFDNNKLRFEGAIVTSNGTFVFGSYYDSETFTSSIYKFEMDGTSLELSDAELLKSKITDEDIEHANFTISVSDNGEFILLDVSVKVDHTLEDEKVENFDVYVFNAEFEELWLNENIQISDEETSMYRYNLEVSNQGTVVMAASASAFSSDMKIVISSINDFFTLIDETQRFILSIQENKEPVLYELKLEEFKLETVEFSFTPDNKVSVIGVYKGKESKERGFYYALINTESGEFEAENMSIFGDMEGVINANSHPNDLQVAEALRLSRNVYPKFSIDLITSDENGSTLIGESYYWDYVNSKYFYYGIAVVRFNYDGEIEWRQGVPKIQFGSGKTKKFCSYGIVQNGNNFGFIFNFSPLKVTNGNLKEQTWVAKKAGDVYIAQVDEGGEVTVDLLMEGGKKPFWKPKKYKSNGNGKAIFVGANGSEIKLFEVSISNF